MPLDVICPWCRDCFFETNDQDKRFELDDRGILFRSFQKPNFRISEFVQKYDPDRPANAAMIRLKDEFREHIDDIPHDCDLMSEAIGPCPGCGNPLSNDNFTFITREQERKWNATPKDNPEPLTIDRIEKAVELQKHSDDYEGTKCRYCGKDHPTSKGRIIHEKRWCKKRPGAE